MDHRRRFSRSVVSAAAVVLLVMSGCSSKFDYGDTGRIKGKLTLNGKVLAPGHAVRFMDREKGFMAYGQTDTDGNFEVLSWNDGNMPIGKYSVAIAAPPVEDTSVNMTTEEKFEKPDLVDPASKLTFPVKYADETKSGLTYDVVKGENHFDIDLKK